MASMTMLRLAVGQRQKDDIGPLTDLGGVEGVEDRGSGWLRKLGWISAHGRPAALVEKPRTSAICGWSVSRRRSSPPT